MDSLLVLPELSFSLYMKLKSCGIETKQDLLNLNPQKISTITNLNLPESIKLYQNCKAVYQYTHSDNDLFESELNNQMKAMYIGLNAKSNKIIEIFIDILEPSRLVEIAGMCGSGKSQLCFQLVASLISINQKIFYIDTEKEMRVERIKQIYEKTYDSSFDGKLKLIFTKVFKYKHISIQDFEDVILRLSPFLKANKEIKVVIIDSIDHVFRLNHSCDQYERSNRLIKIGLTLKKIAHDHSVAIIITNHTRKTQFESHIISSEQLPVLGKKWYKICGNRIILKMEESCALKKLSFKVDRSINSDNSIKYQNFTPKED
ncbi:DNA repair protein RAD51 4 [Intoshia linei]|uniref:DNA repair protein RAD51 homolog 3 n=1 Tax=Intoshia linei TaxID=1819745 RepID=A0A177B0S3_9BILA|nr:DNA repair protein RAD51 4 [Intoshia linei]